MEQLKFDDIYNKTSELFQKDTYDFLNAFVNLAETYRLTTDYIDSIEHYKKSIRHVFQQDVLISSSRSLRDVLASQYLDTDYSIEDFEIISSYVTVGNGFKEGSKILEIYEDLIDSESISNIISFDDFSDNIEKFISSGTLHSSDVDYDCQISIKHKNEIYYLDFYLHDTGDATDVQCQTESSNKSIKDFLVDECSAFIDLKNINTISNDLISVRITYPNAI